MEESCLERVYPPSKVNADKSQEFDFHAQSRVFAKSHCPVIEKMPKIDDRAGKNFTRNEGQKVRQ